MKVSKRDILTILSHGLAVIALLLFIAPIDAAHAEPHAEPTPELVHTHSPSDEHEDHPDLANIPDHCEPGPDCSNAIAFMSTVEMVLDAVGFNRITNDFVSLSKGQTILYDSPPPRQFS